MSQAGSGDNANLWDRHGTSFNVEERRSVMLGDDR